MGKISKAPMPLSGRKGLQNAPPQGSGTIDSDADARDCRTRSTHPSPFPTQELEHTRIGRRARTFELYSQFLSYKHHIDATFVAIPRPFDNDGIVADSPIVFAINANAGLDAG